MRILATIQARMGSTRLPGKVLKPIVGKPMLALQVERIRQSILIDDVVIATTTNAGDDAVERVADELGVGCYRGSEADVLSRVIEALKAFAADVNVEFMADNPIPDPLLVDSIVGFFLKNADRFDYVTNALRTTYPPGAEVHVYPVDTLFDVGEHVDDPALREHVGIHITQNPDRYRIHNLEAPPWYHAPDIHLEVDTPEDFEVVSAVYEHFYPRSPGFTLAEVLGFLREHPEIARRNRDVERRWAAFRQDH